MASNIYGKIPTNFADLISVRIFGEASGTHQRLGLDLRFLRTCRQIYDEAQNVYYKTNIISFDDYDCLVTCVEILSWVSYIRSIRIHIRY